MPFANSGAKRSYDTARKNGSEHTQNPGTFRFVVGRPRRARKSKVKYVPQNGFHRFRIESSRGWNCHQQKATSGHQTSDLSTVVTFDSYVPRTDVSLQSKVSTRHDGDLGYSSPADIDADPKTRFQGSFGIDDTQVHMLPGNYPEYNDFNGAIEEYEVFIRDVSFTWYFMPSTVTSPDRRLNSMAVQA
jgi:hypothetical protein